MMPLIRSRHLLAGMDARLESPAGLARVWTEENTRESIFTPGTLRKRLPKQACAPVTNLSDLQEQSSIYLPERNAEMRAKRSRAEMELAHASNQLIEKRLAERQLAYLLIGMRQKMLLLPGKL